VLFCCVLPSGEPIGFGKMRASIRETFFFERSESPRTGHLSWTVWVVSFSKIVLKACPYSVGTLFFLQYIPCINILRYTILTISSYLYKKVEKTHPNKGGFLSYILSLKVVVPSVQTI
jgi:hypothetical protein